MYGYRLSWHAKFTPSISRSIWLKMEWGNKLTMEKSYSGGSSEPSFFIILQTPWILVWGKRVSSVEAGIKNSNGPALKWN